MGSSQMTEGYGCYGSQNSPLAPVTLRSHPPPAYVVGVPCQCRQGRDRVSSYNLKTQHCPKGERKPWVWV